MQFQILNWDPQGRCSNRHTIITVVEGVYKVQRRTDNKPIVVHCRSVTMYYIHTQVIHHHGSSAAAWFISPPLILQWHCQQVRNVLCHSYHHWPLQEWECGGCLPGGEGSAYSEARACSDSGEYCVTITLSVVFTNIYFRGFSHVLYHHTTCRSSTSLCLKLYLHSLRHL